jgi:5-methyltetrahydropteroyltriglutamate--homocysteine methyltransferase
VSPATAEELGPIAVATVAWLGDNDTPTRVVAGAGAAIEVDRAWRQQCKRSQTRLLTTHVGSLPRVEGLADLLIAREQGEEIDEALFERTVERALAVIVDRQIETGVDVGNDGEMPRSSFSAYVARRMSGFGRGGKIERPLPLDAQKFPMWFDFIRQSGRRRQNVYALPQAIGEVRYDDSLAGVKAECEAFLECLKARPNAFVETFMTAVSPSFIATSMMNNYYDSHEAYVFALARELKKEYEYIASQGFLLQIDAPDMAMERAGYFQDRSLKDFQSTIEMHVAALNLALETIPADQLRLHACWGNRDSPHVYDVPCSEVLSILYQAKVGALCLPFANPRHQHEIEVFRQMPLPDSMLLIPGVIETTNNYVEHPQTVANRLCLAVDCVGDRTRVIAGTDCGFGTIAGDSFTAEDVVWAKLASLREGAEIATKRLWD